MCVFIIFFNHTTTDNLCLNWLCHQAGAVYNSRITAIM